MLTRTVGGVQCSEADGAAVAGIGSMLVRQRKQGGWQDDATQCVTTSGVPASSASSASSRHSSSP